MIKDLDGIVVKERDYGESSKIIDIITKEYGVVGVLAKGSKKMKNNLSGTTNKLTYANFNIYYKEDKLSTLTSVDVINPLMNIKTNILNISYATYICELAYQVIKQSSPRFISEIYDLFISSILKINDGFDPTVITNILELKYLDYLGVSPSLDGCGKCGSKTNILTLSTYYNGLICKNCRTNEKVLDIDTIKHIRMYSYLDISRISKIEVIDKIKREIDEFLSDYYEKHTGLYLNAKAFIKDIKKLT